MRAVGAFLSWCEEHSLAFDDIESITVAAIRMLFDWQAVS
jgi:hypothetical protein